ncbi:MAG: LysM peptidoglycan-binding domain-containing protein [Bacilli bacterium]|nr:LysM peptidoglycan-binding domain-containing protein [Bacilli bacterium]
MDYKIVIDSGHGGIDSGATGNGIIEKDKTLQISKYIYDRLNKLGIPVTMTRIDDETLDPTDRVNRILNAYGNTPNVIVVSNHINAGGGDGAEVLYALRNSDKLSNLILENMKAAGQNVRGAFQRRLPRDPSKDYYFIHRNTGRTEPIIVEYGFLDSKGDDVNQLKNNYEALAEATVKGILEYIGYNYTPPATDSYVVKQGDTLYSISKKLGVSVDELKTLNNLTSNALRVGQTLLIPTNNVIEDTYIVKQGDTLYSISRMTGISIDDIRRINNLDSDILSIGQVILLKDNNMDSNYVEYVVKKGDNLYSISKIYGITQKELMEINNLKSNMLSIGQVLLVPSNGIESTTYIVKPGDTLYQIARNYNTTVDNLKNKNNLTSNTLSIGQLLII